MGTNLKGPAGASFELHGYELEDDRIVVNGLWSGVRGLRFVRPTLVVGDREMLATLEHKPWAPDTDPWVAAFPWYGGTVDTGVMSLAVAPSVTVPLDAEAQPVPGTAEPEPERRPRAEPRRRTAPAPERERPAPALDPRIDQLESQVGLLREERRILEAEHDAVTTERDLLRKQLGEANSVQRRHAQDAGTTREELRHERTIAERERDQALARAEEADQDRAAAVRARDRMQDQLDEVRRTADAEVEAARRAAHEAEGRRDEALVQHDTVRAQRDEVLLAHRTLERQMTAGRAEANRTQTRFTAELMVPGDESEIEDDPDIPIGVRRIPAARGVSGDLLTTPPRHGRDVSPFDVWAIRVLGTVASVCFILLLGMILRAFLL